MKFKRLLALLISVVSLMGCVSCGGGKEEETMEGEYTLLSATLDGADCTKNFLMYKVTLQKDGSMQVSISYIGVLEQRSSTYKCKGDTLTETYNGKTYTYKIEGDKMSTVYNDGYDDINVTLQKKSTDPIETSVNFESVLFGPDLNDSKIFNYCPAILQETVDGKEIMHVWYCTNKDDGVIMDHIGYRKGEKQDNGKWIFSEQKIALAPTPGTWDSRHTCDPAVIRGKFKYKGVEYKYLMSYLGCTTEDYQKNETGIAVANAPEGPWVKINELNPIVPWYDDGNEATEQAKYEAWLGTSTIYWGTGMPALVSVDEGGKVILFYQSTLRGTGVQSWDFSDLDNPKRDYTTSLSSNGVTNSRGLTCSIRIADFAYDPILKRFYVCGVTNEKEPADVTLTRVNSHSMVAFVDNVNSTTDLVELLKGGLYKWTMAGYVGPSDTGWERNHNPGLVRNEYGYLWGSKEIGVVVSTGHNDWNNENIFTYRLHGAIVKAP